MNEELLRELVLALQEQNAHNRRRESREWFRTLFMVGASASGPILLLADWILVRGM